MKNKKGQVLEQMGSLGIGVVVFAMTIIIAFLIISQSQDQVDDLITSSSVINESVAVTNTSITPFANSGMALTGVCNQVYNSSASALISSTNYTCSKDGIQFNGATNLFGSSVLVSYTHTQADSAYNATTIMQSAVEDVPGWIPLIIIAIIGALLLGLVKQFK